MIVFFVVVVVSLLLKVVTLKWSASLLSEGAYERLSDWAFAIAGMTKVMVAVLTLAEASIILDISKNGSDNCLVIHRFQEKNFRIRSQGAL